MNSTTSHPLAVTEATFARDVLETSHQQPVLVDFWAAWCGPCKMIARSLDEIAQERAGQATIAKVDVDAEPDLAARFGIRAIPSLLLFRHGKVVDQLVGVRSKGDYLAHLDQAATA